MQKKVFILHVSALFALALFLLLAVSIVSASVESDFLSLINNERVGLGKSALSYNDNLNQAAYAHSMEMAEKGYFSHDSLDGTSFDLRIANFGYTNYNAVAENIAYATGVSDASRVFNMWKNSPGHYSNMISASYNEIGLGVYSKDGLTYYTLDFGKRTTKPGPTKPVVNSTKPTNPILNSTKPADNSSVNTDNDLFFSIDTTETNKGVYRFIKISGKLNDKSAIYYTSNIDTKVHKICSSCNKFSFFIRTKVDTLQLNLTAENMAGKYVTKTLKI